MANNAAILSLGAVTSVGLCAAETAASVRARIARFAGSPFIGRMNEPITMGYLTPDLLPAADPLVTKFPGMTKSHIRMLRLAGMALAESVKPLSPKSKIPVFLGVPERPETKREFLNLLIAQSGVEIDVLNSRLYPNGRAAGIFALRDAIESLCAGNQKLIVVGGVDCHWDAGLLETLNREGRLKTSLNPNGFIPGEGAAFLLLGLAQTAAALGLSVLGTVGDTGFGYEKGHRYSEKPHLGSGLAETLTDLFSRYGTNEPVRTVYTSLNGESYCGKEWGVAYIRNSTHFSDDAATEHPADCLGDTGAAMAPLMAVLSVIALRGGYKKGPSLIWCTSDRGDCAGCVVQLASPPPAQTNSPALKPVRREPI